MTSDVNLAEMIPAQRSGSQPATHVGHRIIVADRGWVFVGDVTDHGTHLLVTEARCIRKWGTTRGIGELVSGPTSETVLDPCGTLEIPARAVIFTLYTLPAVWQ